MPHSSLRERPRTRRLRVSAAVAAAVLAGSLAACQSASIDPTAETAGSTSPSSTSTSTTSTTHTATPTATPSPWPYLSPASGPGHLAPGSDPSVLPSPILIADKLNNRLIIVDPQGRVRWMFPRKGDLRPGQTFKIPDDAFFSPDGTKIIATEEDDYVVRVIDIATHRITYQYGTPGTPGSGANHLNNPDDALMLPSGELVVPDIKNCRILTIAKGAHSPSRQFGRTHVCRHDPPHTFGSPNGAFPLSNGHFLVTEINGSWVSEMSLSGHVAWTTQLRSVAYPSDSNQIGKDRYLTVDYSRPGQVVTFTHTGHILWRYKPTGSATLNKPSLALPLPNGDVLVTDDLNHRVIVVDPRTDKVVWQYGHLHHAGSAAGYLNNPDGLDLLPPHSLLVSHADALETAHTS